MTPEREAELRALARAGWGEREEPTPEELLHLFAALDEARRERDAYKRAKAENDERFMRERDEARSALCRLIDAHLSASDTERQRGMAEAVETRRGWGM